MRDAGPSLSTLGAIGDGRSVALVSAEGGIDWLCWPRLDSPSIFARLLDPDAGTFVLRPVGSFAAAVQYVPDTNVLSTRWSDGGRALEVLDFMPAADEAHKRLWPEQSVVRRVTCTGGPVELRLELRARPGYGARAADFRERGALGLFADTGDGVLTLQSSRALRRDAEERWSLTLQGGKEVTLVLGFSQDGPAALPPPHTFGLETLALTVGWWRNWARRARYDGPYRDLVVRSALALKLLTFAPSGAIAAAATTSLPELVGGGLNWDYRFCWVRDSGLTVRALQSLGYQEEARAFTSWLLHSTRLSRPEIEVAYDLYGRRPGTERTLPWRGYRDSRPVRVGNAAAEQYQLDVYGEVLDAVSELRPDGEPLDGETRGMLRDFGEFVCVHWEGPDQGIWEPRGPPRHYTHSKALAWVALDRLLELSSRYRFRRFPADRFRLNRDLLRRTVLDHGWSRRLGSYVQTLDGDTLDASLLLLGWYGFHRADSPRMRATARAVQARLSPAPGLLYRNEQGMAEREGAFVICSFWLAELLARGAGTLAEAERLFRHAVAASVSPLGLMSEEVDPVTREPLGNLPQGFSHVGLISAALALEERRAEWTELWRPAAAEAQP